VKDAPDRQPIDQPEAKPAARAGRAPVLEEYFRALAKAGGSDLHLKADCVPHIRVSTELSPTKSRELSGEEIEQMAYELMTEGQHAFFARHGSLDLAYELPGSDRFRLNVYRQRGSVAISVRRVTRDIPDFSSLRLPAAVAQIAEEHQGMVLLAGPTGCGKSTTIAAMLEHINRTRYCHVVSIEDPIEYIYEDKKALINQREIGIDVEDYEMALKYLMRQDPDVVLIGEMRDADTVQAALRASETGHLVFGTVHASGAPQTIGRILDLFPGEFREGTRQALSFNLRAIICQKLLTSMAKGVARVPAVEILRTSPSVRQLIREGRDGELPDLIRANEERGMKSFTASLLELIEQDLVDPQVAYEAAPNVDELKMLMKGITTSQSGLIGH
jgi:twitching motility protein PilT